MCDLILKQERKCPADAGLVGVVFRHPIHGALEILHVENTPSEKIGFWLVQMWVTPASGRKLAFLEECEAKLAEAYKDMPPAAVA
jgi:hypothetical protein